MYSFDLKHGTSSKKDDDQPLDPSERVPAVVYWVGMSSLLADVSAEMLASVLPVFLYSVLQLPPLQVGFFDGLYQGAAALVRVLAGYVADKRRSNKAVALVGYALSFLARIGLLLSTSLGLVFALGSLLADRIGKGIRTAPRDAIIAGHAPARSMAAAFGVHRSMDAVGAFVGPLIAAALLWWRPFDTTWLFAASLFFAGAGLMVFQMRVTDPVISSVLVDVASPASPVSLFASLRMSPAFIKLVGIAVLLSTFTISDGLLYLSVQRRLGLADSQIPLMFVATALVFVLSARPVGRWADRFGPVRCFLLGYLLLGCVYLWFAFGPLRSVAEAAVMVGLIGLHYAATDGVLMAIAARALDPRARTTGMAVLTTAVGLTRIASSSLYGLLWQTRGQETATIVFSLGMTACVGFALLVLTRRGIARTTGERM